MLKFISTFILASLLFLSPVFAQPNNPATAPNWTLTDMNGQSHTLNDYLDQGVTVIMDMWATWCGPCIGSLPGLEQIWASHGFSATGDSSIMILSVEIDGGTSNEASIVSQYMIHNPVFDNGHMIDSLNYSSGFIPTFFVVCPDHSYTMYVGGIGNDPTPLLNIVNSCAAPPTTSVDVQVKDGWYTGDVGACIGDEVNQSLWIKNMGSQPLTSAGVELRMNGTLITTFPWMGNLAQFESEEVVLPSLANFPGTSDLSYTLVNPNGMVDENTADNELTQKVEGLQIYDVELELTLRTDRWGDETSWDIKNSLGVIVAEGGKVSGYGNSSTFVEPITLPVFGECYSFTLYDSYGDGITDGGGFDLIVKTTGQTIMTSSGDFESNTGTKFNNVDNTAIDETAFVNDLKVYPNPFHGEARVSFDLVSAEQVRIDLVDIVGKKLMSKDFGMMGTGHQEVRISAGNIPAGIYFLQVVIGNQHTSRKVTLK